MSLRIEDYSVKTTETSSKKSKKLKSINNKNINVNDNNSQKGIVLNNYLDTVVTS